MNPPFKKSKKSTELHVILSAMRSGSSLCGHLLSEANIVRFAGETRVPLTSTFKILYAKTKIFLRCKNPLRPIPFCDKVVAVNHLPRDNSFLISRVSVFYILLRHPLAIKRAYKEIDWLPANDQYLLNHLKKIREVIMDTPAHQIRTLSYYDLGNPEWQKRFLGKETPSYSMLPCTGKKYWGDPYQSITTGIVRRVTLEEDIERALNVLTPDERSTPLFQEIMKEFRLILKLTGREDLDILS